MVESVRNSRRGLGYLGVAEAIKQKVADGVYAPGERLPTVKELASEYGVSIETASRGVQVLKKAHILRAKPGSGIFVCEPQLDGALTETVTVLASSVPGAGLAAYGEYVEFISSSLLHGIQDEALSSGVRNQIVLVPEQEFRDASAVLRHVRPHLGRQQAGVIVASGLSREVARQLRDLLPFPICFANAHFDDSVQVNVTRVDQYRAARRIMDYLFKMGHRRIGIIGCDPDCHNARFFLERRRAYRDALDAHGAACDPDIIREPESNYVESIEQACLEILSLPVADRPSAVFCFNDFRALMLLRLARVRGVAVPDEISIAGFDGVAQAVAEGVTSVHLPVYQVGMMAITTLKAIVGGAVPQPMITTVEGGEIIGRTVINQDQAER